MPYLETIKDVVDRVDAIEAWERNALSLPIGPSGFQLIEILQKDSQAAAKKEREAFAALEMRARIISTVKESFEAWIEGRLKSTAETIAEAGAVQCTAGELGPDANPDWGVWINNNRVYAHITGYELRLSLAHEQFQKVHCLQIRLCREVSGSSFYGYRRRLNEITDEDGRSQLAIIPFYEQTTLPHTKSASGFLTKNAVLRQRSLAFKLEFKSAPVVSSFRIQPVMAEFNPERSIHTPFNAADWGMADETLRTGLQEAVDAFLAVVRTGPTIFPY